MKYPTFPYPILCPAYLFFGWHRQLPQQSKANIQNACSLFCSLTEFPRLPDFCIQFLLSAPKTDWQPIICSAFSRIPIGGLCRTGVTLSVQHDLYCVYYMDQSTAKIGDLADANYIAIKICVARFHWCFNLRVLVCR